MSPGGGEDFVPKRFNVSLLSVAVIYWLPARRKPLTKTSVYSCHRTGDVLFT